MTLETNSIQPTRGIDWWRFAPAYWFQNTQTDRVWDAALNLALDHYAARMVSGYTCQVGPFRIWVSNWAYAYGHRMEDRGEGLPLVRTRRRLRRMLDQSDGDALAQELSASLSRQNEEKDNG